MALPKDKEEKPCPNPKCDGGKVTFNSRTQKPGTGSVWVSDDEGRGANQPTAAQFEPAWTCDVCHYYEAVGRWHFARA